MKIRRLEHRDIPYLLDIIAAYRHEQGKEFSEHARIAAAVQLEAIADAQNAEAARTSETEPRRQPECPSFAIVATAGRDETAQSRGDGVPAMPAMPAVPAAPGTERPLGYLNAHFGHFPMIGGTELYVSDLLVDSAFRGRGIGSELIEEAEAWARNHGCVRMMLINLRTDQSYHRKFYPSCGFTERDAAANMVKSLLD